MYKIFDKFLKENNFQLRTEIVDGNKFYAVDEYVDGNMITIWVSVEQASIYHSVSVRLVRNIASEQTFDPKLLITIITSFIKVLKNGLLEEALKIKYR